MKHITIILVLLSSVCYAGDIDNKISTVKFCVTSLSNFLERDRTGDNYELSVYMVKDGKWSDYLKDCSNDFKDSTTDN